jgi:hypothetical protein
MLMQRKIKLMSLIAVSLIAGTAGAFAQGYYRYGNSVGWDRVGPGYVTVPPRALYYPGYYPGPYYPGPVGWYGALNGANHPTPGSSQGDVGPGGNNNGTLTGYYRGW